jgi:DNA-binding LacI/PurR family transcriptional regulator
MASNRPFDAIFTASDLIGIGAIKHLQKAGLDIPGDVSVIGFDDIPAASYLNPALTTIRQDTVVAGEMLVDHLIRMINGESPKSQLVTPQLIVRGSCGGRAGPGS